MLLVHHDAHSENAPHLSGFEPSEEHQYDDHEMRERIRQRIQLCEHSKVQRSHTRFLLNLGRTNCLTSHWYQQEVEQFNTI
jgi:hypothetical protein